MALDEPPTTGGSVVIEGLLPSRHITAERAASRTLLIVSEVRLLREGIAESIEGNSGLLVAGTCEKLTQIFAALVDENRHMRRAQRAKFAVERRSRDAADFRSLFDEAPRTADRIAEPAVAGIVRRRAFSAHVPLPHFGEKMRP